MTGVLLRVWRVPALLTVILGGLTLTLLARIAGGADWFLRPAGQGLIRGWMRVLNRVVGLRIWHLCQPLAAPALIVANHISWLDVPALAAVMPMTFVAKADVLRWPLLGRLSALAGTQFLDRTTLAAVRPLLSHVADRLRAGHVCAVFPEGTSTVGDQVRPFFPALFQAAIDAECHLQPVAIEYGQGKVPDPLAPFVGEQSFTAHIWALLGRAHTDVTLSFLAPIEARGSDRRTLARRSHASLEQWLFTDLQPLRRAAVS